MPGTDPGGREGTEPVLRLRWARSGYPAARLDALLAWYGEPHRRYHTAAHLLHMFDVLERDASARQAAAGLSRDDASALELATWYHDCVYQPTGAGNELRSALRFVADAPALGACADVRSRVIQMILVSRHHRPPLGDATLALFCDLDLAILGETPAGYERYRIQVRGEYACYSDEEWRQGRLAFVTACLGRPRLFHVLVDREEPARRNLRQEKDALEGAPFTHAADAEAMPAEG